MLLFHPVYFAVNFQFLDYYIYIYIGFTPSVCPSVRPVVRPASRVRSVAPTVLVGSISYLYILSSNFRRCVTCKFQNLNFWQFFKICNFVLFWLGIWCESLVWVIMWRWGVSQNAGVLVVLVIISVSFLHNYLNSCSHNCMYMYIRRVI